MLRQPLVPAYVPGLQRCSMEFYSALTVAKTESYLHKQRHRFNKWDFLTEVAPVLSSTGLRFTSTNHAKLAGLNTAFTFSGSAALSLTCTMRHLSMGGSCSNAIIGFGLLKFGAPWWEPREAMAAWMTRGVSSGVIQYGTMFNTLSGYSSISAASAFGFSLTLSGGTANLVYTEYDSSGSIIGVRNFSTPVDTTWNQYRVVLFQDITGYVGERGSSVFELVKTSIGSYSGFTIPDKELIVFEQNPDSYELPVPGLRTDTTNLYPLPHTAFLEDANITVGALSSPLGWYRKLKYIADGTIEPFKFTDIEGREFLVCFEKIKGSPRRFRGNAKYGYTCTMQVLVAH